MKWFFFVYFYKMDLILNGVFFGIFISFLVGPAFFILIETSIKKGFKSAVFLDVGILLSDALYLIASLFIAEKINYWLYSVSYIKYIAGGIFIVIGGYSIFKNYLSLKTIPSSKEIKEVNTSSENIIIYPLQLIAKGFGLNAINPAVLVFWIAACTYATKELQIQGAGLLYYFGITIITLFSIDLLKIYFSSKLKNYLNPKNLCYLGIIVGCALVFFGITICFKEIKL